MATHRTVERIARKPTGTLDRREDKAGREAMTPVWAEQQVWEVATVK